MLASDVKYKIGIFFIGDDGNYTLKCNCGNQSISVDEPTMCEKCGTTELINFFGGRRRVLHPYLEIIHKDNKGFKVKRTSLSVIHDKDKLKVKPNMVKILEYSLLNRMAVIYKYKDDKEIETIRLSQPTNYGDRERFKRNISTFFIDIEDSFFVNLISNTATKEFYEFVLKSLSRNQSSTGYWGGYSARQIWRGLFYLLVNDDYAYMQVLSSAGYEKISRFYESYERVINKSGTSPKDIFGLPKFALKYIREDNELSIRHISEIKRSLNKIEGNKFKEMLNIANDESSISSLLNAIEDILQLHNTYGYSNIKKLTLYILREVKMNQGIRRPIDGATLLRDYVRMSEALEQEYEKYPKSLKKNHDVTMMNYNVHKDEIKNKEFENAVNKSTYKELEHFCKEYSIISPKKLDDLIKEGSELSHCISSYSESVIKNQCQIMFLRRSDNLDEPLVSIEVRNGNIRQARGYGNRSVKSKEKEFISIWAREKELIENYY